MLRCFVERGVEDWKFSFYPSFSDLLHHNYSTPNCSSFNSCLQQLPWITYNKKQTFFFFTLFGEWGKSIFTLPLPLSKENVKSVVGGKIEPEKRRCWRKIYLTSSINIIIANTWNRLTSTEWGAIISSSEWRITFQLSSGNRAEVKIGDRVHFISTLKIIDPLWLFDRTTSLRPMHRLIRMQLKINWNKFNSNWNLFREV